jgi:two-component system, NarL family, nitrate/nitrite sensor histidine kinase NarX
MFSGLKNYWPWILVLTLAGSTLAVTAVISNSIFIILLNLLCWGAAGWLFFRADRASARSALHSGELTDDLQKMRNRVEVLEQRNAEESRRVEILIGLNQTLIQATTQSDLPESSELFLMQNALAALNRLVGALGCSYVPVDQMQQPLPPFTFGDLPEPVMRAWATHLADGMLRDHCSNCEALESHPGGCPLHPEQLGDSLSVRCLPLTRRHSETNQHDLKISVGREANENTANMLGVFHFYLPAGRSMNTDMRVFLDVLLRQIALAYESAHLRAQEQSTLRQIQLVRSSEGDLETSLTGLLNGLKQGLEADLIMVQLRPDGTEKLANLSVQCGSPGSLKLDLDGIFPHILHGENLESAVGEYPAWLALPLSLPEGRITGMLLTVLTYPHKFHLRQQSILQTVASQVALLIENERLIRSLEYKVVIQERTRLAREIHDGLAQTLAYLKLQAGQMQSYLAQGDLVRLGQVLKDNYQILAEAYLDTRQAIDDLRLSLQEGLVAGLERSSQEFSSTTGLEVHLEISKNAAARAGIIPIEIQAQIIRIVQEALSNVRKHARAQGVTINLHEWQSDLLLEVSDDGQGFDADDVPEISRHGLRGMRERAELIGADFQVISQAHRGTTVRLVLPAVMQERTSQ